MAGDWIKIEHALADKPEVFIMAEVLKIDPDAVVGKLVRFWAWCDQQTVDGNSLGISDAFIDRLTHQPGFSDALRKVDWLQARSGSLVVPRFDRHNGQTAKARAESARRMAQSRENKRCGDVAEKAQPKPQPEKRREDKEETLSMREPAREATIKDSLTVQPDLDAEKRKLLQKATCELDAHLNGHDAASAMLVLPEQEKPAQGNLAQPRAIPEPDTPTLEACLRYAKEKAIPQPCAEKWWNDQEAYGWRDRHGRTVQQWRKLLNGYAVSWQENERRNPSGHTAGGHYAQSTTPKPAMRKPQPTTSTLDWGADGPPAGALDSWTK